MAQVAETWGCRPSDLVGAGLRNGLISGACASPGQPRRAVAADAMVAWQIDLAAAVALWRWKEEMMERRRRQANL